MKHELNSLATKQLLADTLIQLSLKKPFSKITVSEIVSLCNINRKTFYYHFTDIYDLLEWHLNEEIQKTFHMIDSIYDFDSTISYATEYISQHPYLQQFIEDPLGREKVIQILNRVLSPLIVALLDKAEVTNNQQLNPDFKEFLVTSFSRIVVLAILDHIENPDLYDIEKIKQYLYTIFDLSLSGLFLNKK